MKLFLLRHAEAEPTWPDAERQLTPKGHSTLTTLGQKLNPKLFQNLKKIYHSPYARASQTAEQIKAELSLEATLVEKPGLTPEDNPLQLADFINEQKDHTMFVGHNPHLTLLAGFLLFGDPRAQILEMKKAGLLCLERWGTARENYPVGLWKLNSYITPKSIA